MRLSSCNRALFYALLFLFTPAPSSQVNIKLEFASPSRPNPSSPSPPAYSGFAGLVCNNIQPGKCCKAGPITYSSGEVELEPNLYTRVAEISGLLPLDIAAVWKPSNGRKGCQGLPVDTRPGPGIWYYPDRNQYNGGWAYPEARESENPAEQDTNPWITGGSYMRLPTTMPKPGSQARWLEAEGIVGLAWGNGNWFSENVSPGLASSLLGGTASTSGGQVRKRSELLRRGIISSLKGTVFAQPPELSVWPDQIVFNGTSYNETGVGSLTYISEAGETLTMSAED